MNENDNTAPLDAPEPSPVIRPSVGNTLRLAREARGLQVSEIAQTLKLGKRQVEALERDDWSSLPGQTFVRGFVRNYARLVNVDPAPLMSTLEALLEKPADTLSVPETTPDTVPTSSKPRDRLVAGFGLMLLVLAVAAYVFLPNDLSALRASIQSLIDGEPAAEVQALPVPAVVQTPQEPAFPPGSSVQQVINPQLTDSMAATTEAPAAVAASEPALAIPVQNAAPPAGQLRFVVARESWLEVRDRDGSIVFSQRLPAGAEQVAGGKGPLSITIGYAPGVQLFLRGAPVDLAPHTRGDVARLVLE